MSDMTTEDALRQIKRGLDMLGAHIPGYHGCLKGYLQMRWWLDHHGEPPKRPEDRFNERT
jgi:hypothetical protein